MTLKVVLQQELEDYAGEGANDNTIITRNEVCLDGTCRDTREILHADFDFS